MIKEMFCDDQMYAKYKAYGEDGKPTTNRMIECAQDDPKAELTCTAHLAEGRAWPCPFTPEEIYERDGKQNIAHKKGGKLVGKCEDFKPPEQQEAQAKPSSPR